MLIYRIENETGDGVYYIGHDSIHDIIPLTKMRHPIAADDSKLCRALKINEYESRYITSDRFGFKNLDQLKSWFYSDEVRWFIDSQDFAVSVYESETVFVGDTQVIFDYPAAKLIEKFSILDA